MMIRNVIFDVGNVLIEFDWQKFLRNLFDEETAKKLKVDSLLVVPAGTKIEL